MRRGGGIVLFVATAATLGGCASMQKTFDGWFGESESESAAPADSEGSIYYAAVDGLSVHEDAAGSAKVIGHLAQYEQVKRTRLEHGYAFVTAEKSGVEGWVDNAQLVWRLPGSGEERKPAADDGGNRGAAEAPAPAAAEKAGQATEPPTATPTGTPDVPPPTPIPAPPTQIIPPTAAPTPAKSKPSMFDPF